MKSFNRQKQKQCPTATINDSAIHPDWDPEAGNDPGDEQETIKPAKLFP